MFEANKAEILRRMEKIRKHLARIDEIIQCGEDKEELWYPPDDPEFGPWIDFNGVVCPIDPDSICDLFLKNEREENRFAKCADKASGWSWGNGDIIAYRIKK